MPKDTNILDCTLRDGGFTNDFNWNENFVNEYFKLTNRLPIKYIEVGYWKQKNKSKNKYYNINEKDLKRFKRKSIHKLAIINDFHYSSKNIYDYPTKKDNIVSLIRVTSRVEDLDECIEFINKLKKYSKLKISLNIFNFSNYSIATLNSKLNIIKKSKFDYLYFADTHGSLDFFNLEENFEKFILKLKKINKIVGFHFHDNIGTAYSNYIFSRNNNFTTFDSTITGIGRGGGNLKTEIIFKNDLINQFILKFKKDLYVEDNLYTLVTGKWSVSNLYAAFAKQNNINIVDFEKFCKKLKLKNKDNFNFLKIKNYFR